MAYKKKPRPVIKKLKNWNKVVIFLTNTRNNIFVNILDYEGIHLFRSSGGHVCYVKDFERWAKKSKEVLSFLAILTATFLRRKNVKRLAFIFNQKWKIASRFLKRVLSRNFEKRKFRVIFIGNGLNLPFGGCRAGKRRNFRSERKKKRYTKRWNIFKSKNRPHLRQGFGPFLKINGN